MVKNMTIYKKTEQLIITTNMVVKLKDIEDNKFKISDVIDHLLQNEDKIVDLTPLYMKLMDVCITALEVQRDEVVVLDHTAITGSRNLRPRTFFYPSCRIIRVDLTEGHKRAYSAAGRIPKCNLEEGYDMVPKKGAHSVLVIKIERMTDVECYATWTLVN